MKTREPKVAHPCCTQFPWLIQVNANNFIDLFSKVCRFLNVNQNNARFVTVLLLE